MASKKISELTAAGALTGTELVEAVQGGINVKTTTQDIADLGGGGGGGTWGSITGTLSSQTDLAAALNSKSDAAVTYRTLTSDHTLDSTDLASLATGDSLVIEENQAIANDVTVPANSSVAFPVGSVITIVQMGAGLTSIIADGGVTINNSAGHLNSPGRYSPMVLVKKATDTWYLFNGLPSSTATWQNWGASLTPTGFSSLSVQTAYYKDDGNMVTIWAAIGGTSNATAFTFALPFAVNANYPANGLILPFRIQNNGTNALGMIQGTTSSSTVSVFSTILAAAFTASGGKVVWFTFSYQKA